MLVVVLVAVILDVVIVGAMGVAILFRFSQKENNETGETGTDVSRNRLRRTLVAVVLRVYT